MADGAAKGAQLDALSALLATARDLSVELANDASLGRLLRAFLMLPTEDRDAMAAVLERAAAYRRASEHGAEATGIRLVPNPNPRLYVRVVDPAPSAELTTFAGQDHDELVLAAIRLTKLAVILDRPEMRSEWTPSAVEAFRLVEPEERAAYVRLARYAIELIEAVEREDADDPEPGAPKT